MVKENNMRHEITGLCKVYVLLHNIAVGVNSKTGGLSQPLRPPPPPPTPSPLPSRVRTGENATRGVLSGVGIATVQGLLGVVREWGQTSQTLHPHWAWLWWTRQVQTRQVQPSRRKHHPSHSLLERAHLPAVPPKLVARIRKGVFCGHGGTAPG